VAAFLARSLRSFLVILRAATDEGWVWLSEKGFCVDRESGQAAMMFESTVMFQASSSHSGM
jgi:hypothetical protein